MIDRFLPRYDVVSRYGVDVRASAEDAYAAVLRCDLGSSWISRGLIALRGLRRPGSGVPVLEHLLKEGFVRLLDDPPREIVMGLVGQFWGPGGDVRRIEPSAFASFSQPGVAKAAWNFSVARSSGGLVRVATETRVLCGDAAAKRKFILYWTVIRPFSGLIRREMLKEIQQRASAPG